MKLFFKEFFLLNWLLFHLLYTCSLDSDLISNVQALKTSPSQSAGESATKNWQGVIDCLNGLLSTLKDNFVCKTTCVCTRICLVCILLKSMFQVPPVLVQKMFIQLFCYINVQLFNRYHLCHHLHILLNMLQYSTYNLV